MRGILSAEHRVQIDRKDSRRAPDALAFGQAGKDPNDELRRGSLAMKNRAVGLVEIPVIGDTLQLPPGLASGITIGAQGTASEPAVGGTIRSGTDVRSGVDNTPTYSRASKHRGRRGRRHVGAPIRTLFTSL